MYGFNYSKLSNLTSYNAIKACASYILTHSLIYQYTIQKEIKLSDNEKENLEKDNYRLKKNRLKITCPPNLDIKNN